MARRIIRFIVIISALYCVDVFAQEVINNFNERGLVILNEEIRKLNARVEALEALH